MIDENDNNMIWDKVIFAPNTKNKKIPNEITIYVYIGV